MGENRSEIDFECLVRFSVTNLGMTCTFDIKKFSSIWLLQAQEWFIPLCRKPSKSCRKHAVVNMELLTELSTDCGSRDRSLRSDADTNSTVKAKKATNKPECYHCSVRVVSWGEAENRCLQKRTCGTADLLVSPWSLGTLWSS